MNADIESDRRWLAFETEAMPHVDRLFRHAMWLARNRAEAEDLVQETLVQALQSFHRFTPGTNCRAWLVSILQYVTLKTDPDPGTVDLVRLRDGAIAGAVPVAVSAPAGTLTPFGFSVYPNGTAIITLAHSSQAGLFRDGAFTSVIDAGQAADCWSTRAGKYVFTANTGSKTISRLVGTGNHVFVDASVAASISTGGAPADIDTDEGVLGVIDHGAGQSHLSLFTYNAFGELTASGVPINVGVPNANGVAIMAPSDRDHE